MDATVVMGRRTWDSIGRPLPACRERYREELRNGIERTRALDARGDRAAAALELQKIDARFGGLAAPFYDLSN